VTWRHLQKKLGPTDAAIEILRFRVYDLNQHLLSDSVVYAALIVTASSKYPEIVIIENGDDLEGKSLKAYRNFSTGQVEDTRSYRVYWQKIQDKLKGVQKVYISADGVYHQININTLMNPVTRAFVGDGLQVIQLLNLSDMLVTKVDENINRSGVLFGSPDFFNHDSKAQATFTEKNDIKKIDGTQRGILLEDLPGTKAEVETISQIMKDKGWRTQTYLGADATEENLKSSYKPKVLHIATHGYFNLGKFSDEGLSKSGLVFAGGGKALSDMLDKNLPSAKGEDGILTPFEAMNLNLENTDLVVLSACQSGLGEVKPGEGIYGLQRAFKMAGARTLMLSLWPVDDQATEYFISSFYKNWFSNNLSKADSFKAAQQATREKYNTPYYWGAFVLIGGN
jgi:hypothetical protein